MLSLAFYTNSKTDLSTIKTLKQDIGDQLNIKLFDFLLFTDDIQEVTNYDIAILPTFYMEFYKDYLVFTNLNDYLIYRNKLLTKHIILYIDNINSLPEHADRKLLQNFEHILTLKNNELLTVQL